MTACVRGSGKSACAILSSPFCRLPTAYTGNRSLTASGRTCQAWDSQRPHRHNFTTLGAHNHCRNPDGDVGPWCFTADEGERWEYCFPDCTGCVASNGTCAAMGSLSCRVSTAYDGPQNATISGLPCKKWADQDKEFAAMGSHNECRNPDNEHGPWCYVDAPDKRWEYCFASCGGCKCPAQPVVFPATQLFGEIYSPRETSQYCGNLRCGWRIENDDPSLLLHLRLVHFATENRVDFLDLKYVSGNRTFPLRRLSGMMDESHLPNFDFGVGAVELEFQSDATIHGAGFHATFHRAPKPGVAGCLCPVEVVSVGRVPVRIASPGFDGDGCAHITCHVMLSAGEGAEVALLIEQLHLGPGGGLELLDLGGTRSIARFTTSLSESRLLHSGSGDLFLHYAASPRLKSRGFLALARRVIGPCSCAQDVEEMAPSGFLVSPGFPGLFCPSLNCSWTIKVHASQRVQLRFEHLKLRGEGSRLIVADKDGGFEEPQIFWPYLDSDHVYTAQSSELSLRLVTSEFSQEVNEEMTGFNISWSSVPKDEACVCTEVSETNLLSGQINQAACSAMDCMFALAKPLNATKLLLWVDELEIENMGNAPDFVNLYDGAMGDAKPPSILFTLSSNIPHMVGRGLEFPVGRTAALVYFHTGGAGPSPGRGLRLRYEWALRDCRCENVDLLIEAPGQLVSPNYPEEYCHQSVCSWTLRAPPGHVVHLDVQDFATEAFDRLRLGEPDNSTIAVLSGRASGRFESAGPTLILTFVTDTSIAQRGFRIAYKAEPRHIPTDIPPRTQLRSTTTSRPTTNPTSPPASTVRKTSFATTTSTAAPSPSSTPSTRASTSSASPTTPAFVLATTRRHSSTTSSTTKFTSPRRLIERTVTFPTATTKRTVTKANVKTTFGTTTPSTPRLKLPRDLFVGKDSMTSANITSSDQFMRLLVQGTALEGMDECGKLRSDLAIVRKKYYQMMMMKAMLEMEKNEDPKLSLRKLHKQFDQLLGSEIRPFLSH